MQDFSPLGFIGQHKNNSTPMRLRRSAAARLSAAVYSDVRGVVCESLERRVMLSGAILGAATNYQTASRPESIAIADFNGDGKLDIATGNYNGTVDIFFGNGDGTFKAPVVIPDGLGNAPTQAQLAI